MKLFVLTFIIFISSTNASEWKYLETYEGVKLYEKVNSAKGSTPFKAEATVNLSIEEIVKILLDVDQKQEWAPKLKNVTVHKSSGNNEFIFSEFYKTPWPYYDREFLLKGKIYQEGRKVYFKAKDFEDESLEHDDHVAANVSVLDFILEDSGKGTLITFTFNGDMGGWIPSFVSRIIRKKWPVRFIQALEKWSVSGKVKSTKYFDDFMKSISK